MIASYLNKGLEGIVARTFVIRQLDIGIVALLVGFPDSMYEDFKSKVLYIYGWQGTTSTCIAKDLDRAEPAARVNGLHYSIPAITSTQ